MALPTTQTKTSTTNAAAATTTPANNAQLRVLTEKLAYELWEKKGRKHGQDVENWVEAEKMAQKRLGL